VEQARALSRFNVNSSAGRKEVGVGFRKAYFMKINNLTCFLKSQGKYFDCELWGHKSVAEVVVCLLRWSHHLFSHTDRYRSVCFRPQHKIQMDLAWEC